MNHFCLRSLFCIFSLWLIAVTASAAWQYRCFDVNTGLSSSNIVDITQDRKGFVWITTEDGLNRFDGNGFSVYRNIPSDAFEYIVRDESKIDSNQLIDNYCSTIYIDHKGIYWIGNLPAVTINDIMDERFRELAGEEGIRWTDLRSWHAAGFIDLGTWTAADFGYNYDTANFEFNVPEHLLFPIPQGEMNTNPLMMNSGNNPDY